MTTKTSVKGILAYLVKKGHLTKAQAKNMLDAVETAKAFDWKLKVVLPGKLVTFCRDSGCIPVRLKNVKSKTVGGRLVLARRRALQEHDASATGERVGERGIELGQRGLPPDEVAR